MIESMVYTSQDLKRLLACSSRTVSRVTKRDGFPRAVVAGRWLRSDVDRWIVERSRCQLLPITAKSRQRAK